METTTINLTSDTSSKEGACKLEFTRGTPCLLCGTIVPMVWERDFPKVCMNCKKLWKRIKERMEDE